MKEYVFTKIDKSDVSFILSSKEEHEKQIGVLSTKIEELMSNIKHISEKYKDPLNKNCVREDIVKSENNIHKYRDRLSQYQAKLGKIKSNEVISYQKYKAELTELSCKQEDINVELRELYQQITEIDEESLSEMEEVLEKKNKISFNVKDGIERIYSLLDSDVVSEKVSVIKNELESYKYNMDRLTRYKIKESTLSDLFNKKKTNDRINEEISEKNKLLEGYKQEETLLNKKYNDSVQLVESINELDMLINKTNVKMEKSEMEYDRNKLFLWEDNYHIHLENIENQKKINELKQKGSRSHQSQRDTK